MLDKFAIAAALREVALLLGMKGENPFKVRAYERGARAVDELSEALGLLIDERRLTSVPGIGAALAAQIAELHATGRSELLEGLRVELPSGIVELSQVPNLGPKKIEQLRQALGIASVGELKAACEAGRVRELKGFGEKTEAKILASIARWERRDTRTLLVDAMDEGERLLAHLRASPLVEAAELAGSLRRFAETVSDLDVVVATSAPSDVMDHFTRYPLVREVEARGDTKCTVRLARGLQVDLRAVPRADFATALHHFTGSKQHHVKLRGRARALGLTLSEWGLERIDGGGKLPIADEAELYRRLGLPEIPPELREDEGELEAAAGGARFDDLVTLGDIQGMVHCHTTFSDGKNSVEEMAVAADAMGMKYLTITDHSPAAHYANGVALDRLKAQWDEIARVQEKVEVQLLRGTESDILETGALDYPDAVLELFDVIIASIHSRMQMDAEQMTRRLVAAMRQPVFKIWGHALGRLIQRREPFDCRVEEILDAVAGSRAAVEVNGDPYRLDLAPPWIREARKRGIRFVISTDAHSVRALGNLRYGIGTARRGGVRRGEVLNALPLDGFMAAVRPAG